MIAELSRRLLQRLMRSRAERHSGCRIDLARLRTDPEYASAIRALAQFTLDEELRTLGAAANFDFGAFDAIDSDPDVAGGTTALHWSARSARILPFRRQAAL